MATFALNRTTTLGQHLHQAAGATTQIFDAYQFVVDGAVTTRRQICFVRHHRRVERREPGANFVFGLVASSFLVGKGLQASLQATNLAARHMQTQRAQFGDQCTVAACGIGLALERFELTAHFAQQILGAHQVGFGALQATLGFFFALAMLQHTRGFFDDRPTIFGASIQHRIDLALAHDHVLLAADTGI